MLWGWGGDAMVLLLGRCPATSTHYTHMNIQTHHERQRVLDVRREQKGLRRGGLGAVQGALGGAGHVVGHAGVGGDALGGALAGRGQVQRGGQGRYAAEEALVVLPCGVLGKGGLC